MKGRNVGAFSVIAGSRRPFISSSNRSVGAISEYFFPTPLTLSLPFSCISSNFDVLLAHFHSGRRIQSQNKGVFNSGFADNIQSLEDAVGLYKLMIRMRHLLSVIEFNQLLGRVVKMKQYSAASAV